MERTSEYWVSHVGPTLSLYTLPPSQFTCTPALTVHHYHSSSSPTTPHRLSPLSLLSLSPPPPNTPGRETSAMEVYLVLGVVMIPVLYFAGAGGTVFWIIGEGMAWPVRPTLVTSPPPPPPLSSPRCLSGGGTVACCSVCPARARRRPRAGHRHGGCHRVLTTPPHMT